MPNYQLRITANVFDESHEVNDAGPAPEIFQALTRIAAHGACTDWLVYQHDADTGCERTHIHVYFFNWGLQETAFRRRFRQEMPYIQDRDFAISTTAGGGRGVITLEGAVRYASKDGTISVAHVRGFDLYRIQEMEEALRRPVNEIIPAVVRPPRQMTKWQCVELVRAEFAQWRRQNGEMTKHQQVMVCLEVLREYQQVFSHHRVIEILETIATHEGRDSHLIENVVNSLRY